MATNRVFTTALAALLGVAVIAGCGDDDDGSVEAFCARFADGEQPTTGLGAQDSLEEARVFFAGLSEDAPGEISEEIETLSTGTEALLEAYEDFEGAEGAEALEAVQESADVSLEDLATAATTVEQYAVENCDAVEQPAE